jgi:hypothetical protein
MSLNIFELMFVMERVAPCKCGSMFIIIKLVCVGLKMRDVLPKFL